MNAADKYYLKAKEYYGYDYEETIEALEYGLSHDSEHPGLLTLMGTLYYRDLKQFHEAVTCFENALSVDPWYVDAYYAYIDLALLTDQLKRAQKLITTAMKVVGIDKASILYKEALLLEKKGAYKEAVDSLTKAKQVCMSTKQHTYYEEEAERIKQKEKYHEDCKSPIRIILK